MHSDEYEENRGRRQCQDTERGVVAQFASEGSYQGFASAMPLNGCVGKGFSRCALPAWPQRLKPIDPLPCALRHASKACPDTNLS
jgi:hypothetical protein